MGKLATKPTNESLAFGRRLSKAMELRGVSPSALARTLGVTAGAVSNWSRGRSMANRLTLPKICVALAVPSDWLVYGVSDLSDAAWDASGLPQIRASDTAASRQLLQRQVEAIALALSAAGDLASLNAWIEVGKRLAALEGGPAADPPCATFGPDRGPSEVASGSPIP